MAHLVGSCMCRGRQQRDEQETNQGRQTDTARHPETNRQWVSRVCQRSETEEEIQEGRAENEPRLDLRSVNERS